MGGGSGDGRDGGAPEAEASLLDALPVLVWRTGPGGKAVAFNRTWLEFTGHSLARELGDGWLQGLHPSEHDATVLGYLSAFQARRPFQLEHRLRRADGEYRWMVSTGRPLWVAGVFQGFVGTSTDITDPRRSEAAALEARSQVMTAESRAQRSRWELLERELGELEQLSAPEQGRRRVGVGPLQQVASVFAELSKRYGELLELSLERRVYKNVTAEPSEGLRSLGERLGALRAGPRDVVDLHTQVLGAKARGAPIAKAQAYVAEGRLLVLELMGYLVAFYRNSAFGLGEDESSLRAPPGRKGEGPGDG
jgi:PAS domain S-box-containing protein